MCIVNDKFLETVFFLFFVNRKVFLWVNLSKYHSTSVGAYNNFSVRARVSYEAFQVLFLFLAPLSTNRNVPSAKNMELYYDSILFNCLKTKKKEKSMYEINYLYLVVYPYY